MALLCVLQSDIIQQLREMIPPPSQTTVSVSNQNTLLILYYSISRLVTLFKVTDASIQGSDIWILLLISS